METKSKFTPNYYYQVRYDSHVLAILTSTLEKYITTKFQYVIGKEYKKDGKPHNQCLISTEIELNQNVRTKIRENIKKELKNVNIVHDNRCSISVAKCPYSLMNYCTKEGKVTTTLTAETIVVITDLPRKEAKKDFQDKLNAMLKSNMVHYRHTYDIALFYEAIVCFYLDNDRRQPSRQTLRHLALKFKMLSIQQYLHLTGLNNDHST